MAALAMRLISYYIACHPTVFYCHSVLHPCASGPVPHCTALCPQLTGYCPVASPGCPPVGPGTPVQGQAAAMAEPAMAMGQFPSFACSYAPDCWYSYRACPTQYGCGPHHTPACPQFQAQAPAAAAGPEAAMGQAIYPSVACSYAPGCWYSYGACPTQYGCGPHHTPGCPQFQVQAPPQAAGYYHPWTAACSVASCGHPCTR